MTTLDSVDAGIDLTNPDWPPVGIGFTGLTTTLAPMVVVVVVVVTARERFKFKPTKWCVNRFLWARAGLIFHLQLFAMNHILHALIWKLATRINSAVLDKALFSNFDPSCLALTLKVITTEAKLQKREASNSNMSVEAGRHEGCRRRSVKKFIRLRVTGLCNTWSLYRLNGRWIQLPNLLAASKCSCSIHFEFHPAEA